MVTFRRICTLTCTLTICCISALSLEAQELMHYWNFNNSTSEAALLAPTESLVSGASLQHIQGGASAIQLTQNTGQGFDVLNLNARNGDAALSHLRLNNPIGATLIIAMPTTGFEQVTVRYATRRSGQGAGTQIVEYSADGVNFDTLITFNPVDADPSLHTLNLTQVAEADDNPDFMIRITFAEGPGGTEGNNRIDNLTMDGFSLGSDTFPPSVSFDPACGSLDVEVLVTPELTFDEEVRLINDDPLTPQDIQAIVELRKDSIDGETINFSGDFALNTITIFPNEPLQNNTEYILVLVGNTIEDINNNALIEPQICSFSTIGLQTEFAPGDIVPVAYRMNAIDADDAIAYLTLVDILPGTKLNLTDTKYTTNAQPQCPGGLVWTSPDEVLLAGSVFIIWPETSTASTGTLTGASFGLSAGGDQLILYTGDVVFPDYVSALSSNAWLTGTHTNCGGNTSLLPAGLVDGSSSIQLSSAPGSVGGNTVNGYYAGTQDGTYEELRTLILDPANWNGIGAGTPAQEWPEFSFPGPPKVTEVLVVNQNQLRVVYDQDMDPASATDVVNYTGIAGLEEITLTTNGSAPDHVTLTFEQAFVSGTTYTLQIQNVQDAAGRVMAGVFTFTFEYITTIGFASRYTSVRENDGSVSIPLTLANPSTAQVRLSYTGGAFSTATPADINFSPMTLTLNGAQGQFNVNVPIVDDLFGEQDEYFVLKLENINGTAIEGSEYYTVYIRDNDIPAPVQSNDITLDFLSRYTVDNPDEESGLSEIVAYDQMSQRLFTISTGLVQFDIINFANPANPTEVAVVDVSSHGSGITSVAAQGGIVAVTVTGLNNPQENGSVLFYNTNGVFQKKVIVGALPDMLTFTPDGHYLLTANEGEPNDDYSIDPKGSVSIIDMTGGLSNVSQSDVTTVTFDQFNDDEDELIQAGVRKLFEASSIAEDFEPEFLTVSADVTKAWVTLQENNAIAELDLLTKQFTRVWPLGAKNYAEPGNGLDLSDRNNIVHLSNWPVWGYYIPDGIANYQVNNNTYLITANEGDEKELSALNERTTVADIVLDPVIFPNAALLQEEHHMGRFRISNLQGDTDDDGDYDLMFALGGRSFTIWDAETGFRVWDSGDDFERITANLPLTAPIFNADSESNTFKGRSRSKGPEPEGVTIAKLNSRYYAFITLERIGGVMVYDVTNPLNPELTDYINTRNNMVLGGDLGPEGVLYVQHNNGNHYLLTANEISGTVAVFEIDGVITSTDTPGPERDIVIYPNPVYDGTIYFTEPQSFSIQDLHGRVMGEAKEVMLYDVHCFHPGVYTLSFDNGAVRKLVIE